MGLWKAAEVTQTLPMPPLFWLIKQLSLRWRRKPCGVQTPGLGHSLLEFGCFLYLLFISHRSMGYRWMGATVQGEQLPGNCVLLQKGSLMAPARPALRSSVCICRNNQLWLLHAIPITLSWKSEAACVWQSKCTWTCTLFSHQLRVFQQPDFMNCLVSASHRDQRDCSSGLHVQHTLLDKRFNCLVYLIWDRFLFFPLVPIRLMRRFHLATSRN